MHNLPYISYALCSIYHHICVPNICTIICIYAPSSTYIYSSSLTMMLFAHLSGNSICTIFHTYDMHHISPYRCSKYMHHMYICSIFHIYIFFLTVYDAVFTVKWELIYGQSSTNMICYIYHHNVYQIYAPSSSSSSLPSSSSSPSSHRPVFPLFTARPSSGHPLSFSGSADHLHGQSLPQIHLAIERNTFCN